MKLNESLVTVSAGYITVDQELQLGDDITLEIEGSVIERKESDNQDGTFNLVCKVKGAICNVKQRGKVISSEEGTEL